MNYGARAKTARMTAVRDDIDSGSGPGVLQIGTAGMAAVLAEIPLADPCGTVSGATLTFSGMPRSTTALNSGTAAAARVRDSAGVDVMINLTVGTSSADVIVSTTNFVAGGDVDLLSASVTHAA